MAKKKRIFKVGGKAESGKNTTATKDTDVSYTDNGSNDFVSAIQPLNDAEVEQFFKTKLSNETIKNKDDASRWAEQVVTEKNLAYFLGELNDYLEETQNKIENATKTEGSGSAPGNLNGDGNETQDSFSPEESEGSGETNDHHHDDDNDGQGNSPSPDPSEGWGQLPPELQAQLDNQALEFGDGELDEAFEEAKKQIEKRMQEAQAFVMMILMRLDNLEAHNEKQDHRLDDHEERITNLEKSQGDQDKALVNIQAKLDEIKITEVVREVIHINNGANVRVVDGIVPEQFKDVLELAQARMNIMLYGPTGSGKTHLAKVIAEALDLPYYAQSCSEGMNESVFMGMRLPDESGAFKYFPSKFVEMFENGGVYCIDEIDAADSNLLIYPNTGLSNGYLFLELDGGRMVKRHKDFICIATANSAGHGGDMSYLRNELDVATLRRFKTGMIEVGYSKKVEKKLIDNAVLSWGTAGRKALDLLGIDRHPISTGTLIEFTFMKDNFSWDRKRWERAFTQGMSYDDAKSFKERTNDIIKEQIADLKSKIASGHHSDDDAPSMNAHTTDDGIPF